MTLPLYMRGDSCILDGRARFCGHDHPTPANGGDRALKTATSESMLQ
jgi:hypothetical protein